MSYIVALTGASGAIYGLRLIDELLKRGDDVELIISPSGFLILEAELDLRVKEGKVAGALMAFLKGTESGGKAKKAPGSLNYHPTDNLTSALASGSARMKKMIVCPCSMGTLSRIASGASGNLVERAADCVLKERGTLVLVPRETPLNSIHLENMLKLSRAGAVVMPAMPGFYARPVSVDDMVDFMVGKILDMLGIDNDLFKRWNG